jgi:hypothetical protein
VESGLNACNNQPPVQQCKEFDSVLDVNWSTCLARIDHVIIMRRTRGPSSGCADAILFISARHLTERALAPGLSASTVTPDVRLEASISALFFVS